jgi:hypothetical protein
MVSAFGIGVASHLPDVTLAKKKKKKLQFNQFGCVNVGGKCRGNSANCCSGICEGKKPKKGKKDTSRCVAHGQSTCFAGQNEPFCGGTGEVACLTSAGETGECTTTTGNAGYCVRSGRCLACKKDEDCQNNPDFGAGAACTVCTGCTETGGTACSQSFLLT